MPCSNRSRRIGACALIGAVALTLHSSAATAQDSIERYGLDSVLSIDAFGGENVSNQPQIIIDVAGVVRLSDRTRAYFRPWLRLPRPNTPTAPTPDWSHELYQASIQYERAGRNGRPAMRVDAGYNVSPIGLGIPDTRPSLNPLIAPHISYLTPMPVFEPTGPRVSAISQSYPLGAQLTVSSLHWDVRGAVLNAAPTRNYAVGRPAKPRQTPVLVAGGGISPVIGLRVGVSFAQGNYATDSEVTGASPSDRSVTMIGGEGEYAFGYTKISGEIVRSRFERSAGEAVAYEYFVQGMHSLAPRWFVAARNEGTSAPPLVSGIVVGKRTRLTMVETTVGFRVTPDITLRSSYYTRKGYGASAWDQQVGVSAVWARKWW